MRKNFLIWSVFTLAAVLVAAFLLIRINDYSNELASVVNVIDTKKQEPINDELGGSSWDKALTLFTRRYPERPRLNLGWSDEALDNEIWIKDNNTEKETLLVKSGETSKYSFTDSDSFPFPGISGLSSPVFSLDKKKVYFMSMAWVTSNAVFSADVSAGELRFITDGNSVDVITRGSYKDNLIVFKHKYYEAPKEGSYDHFYIITDTGKEIKDLGEEFNKEDFGVSAGNISDLIIWTGKIDIDKEEMAGIQKAIDDGHQPWRTDPKEIACVDSSMYGFNLIGDCETLKEVYSAADIPGIIKYQVTAMGKDYIITVIQPVVGEGKIWTISEIYEL